MTDDRLDLLVVAPYAQRGGSELYLRMLLPRLPDRFSCRVVSLQEGPLVASLRELGMSVRVVATSARPRAMLASGLELRRMLHLNKPDVIHANGLKAALVAAVAAFPRRVPIVWVKHDFGWDGWLTRLAGTVATSIIGVSRSVTRTFGRRLRRKVRIVYNGLPSLEVDVHHARARLRKLVQVPEDGAVVSLVGRMNPVKGHHELIAMAPSIRRRVPGVHFALIGGEDETAAAHVEYVKTLINETDLENVTLVGHRDDVHELMAGSDVTVMPSVPDERGLVPEAFPFVALEAMALGTPLVAYDVGGISEAVGDCGRLVSLGEQEAFADAVVELLSDPDARAGLSRCGRARVQENFSIDRMVTETIAVLEEASGR